MKQATRHGLCHGLNAIYATRIKNPYREGKLNSGQVGIYPVPYRLVAVVAGLLLIAAVIFRHGR